MSKFPLDVPQGWVLYAGDGWRGKTADLTAQGQVLEIKYERSRFYLNVLLREVEP